MKEVAVNDIVRLLLAEQDGDITPDEQAALNSWKLALKENATFYDRCQDEAEVSRSMAAMLRYNTDDGWQQFRTRQGLNELPIIPVHKRYWYWLMAAATLVVSLTALALWIAKKEQPVIQPIALVNKGESMLPGPNKATLTLSDGRIIVLEDQKNGVVTEDQGMSVRKKGEMLEYERGGKSVENQKSEEPVAYNTARTARGSFIAITLPDNTKVWLNADASLRFPVRFTGTERRVELTGEAYFEVAKQPAKPFTVATSDAEIRVLGTHFNVRSYNNEEVKTTLLEGRVEVKALDKNSKIILKPAQQATVSENRSGIEVQEVETEPVVAWKNGLFDFKAMPLKDILQEVRRWYPDVEAIEMSKPSDERFSATVSRKLPLSKLLEILEATDRVHFEIRGKTIYVTE